MSEWKVGSDWETPGHCEAITWQPAIHRPPILPLGQLTRSGVQVACIYDLHFYHDETAQGLNLQIADAHLRKTSGHQGSFVCGSQWLPRSPSAMAGSLRVYPHKCAKARPVSRNATYLVLGVLCVLWLRNYMRFLLDSHTLRPHRPIDSQDSINDRIARHNETSSIAVLCPEHTIQSREYADRTSELNGGS